MAGFKFKCGQMAKDRVTGQVGMITTAQKHIARCNSYWLQPVEPNKDGDKRSEFCVEEPLVELVGEGEELPVWGGAPRGTIR